MGTLPSDLTDFGDHGGVDCLALSDTLKEHENPQHQYQYNLHDSLLIPDILSLEKISTEPDKGTKTNSLISDVGDTLLSRFKSYMEICIQYST